MGSVGLAHQVGGALGVGVGGLSVARTGSYDAAVGVVLVVVLVGGLFATGDPERASSGAAAPPCLNCPT